MPSKFNPISRRLRTFEEAIEDIVADEATDTRLTAGQIHAIVRLLYGEPVLKIAAALALDADPRSKVTMDRKTWLAANLALHDRMYPPLAPRDAKAKAIEEFQMEFAWMDNDEAVKEAANDG